MRTTATDASPHPHRRALRAGLAAMAGTTIEWYDFYVYATAAALIFPQIFFPEADRSLGTLAAFGTYAVAFFMRPLGGILFGHIGDRYGRKPALTITLVLMGGATVLVGCLPNYHSWGPLSAVLLIVLRMLQGLAVGGEWGGASLLAVESAPARFKVFYGGFTQLGNPLGALMATGGFWILSARGEDFLLSWGWRLPFLFSIVLIGVGLWIRYRVEETPVFEAAVEGKEQSSPLVFAVRTNWWPMLLGFCIVAISTGGYTIGTTFVQNFAVSPEVGLAASVILGAMTVDSFVEALVILPLAWLGDRWDSRALMGVGIVLSFGVFIPLLIAIDNHLVTLIYLLAAAIRITIGCVWATFSTVLTQMFPPQARYTSMSLAYGIGAAVWGGLTPVAAAALRATTGSYWPVVALFGLLCAIAGFGVYFAPQHTDPEPTIGSSAPPAEVPASGSAPPSAVGQPAVGQPAMGQPATDPLPLRT